MNESERKERGEAFIELPLVAVHTDNPISQVELRTNGDRVANVNGGTPQCNQVWGDFIVRACNSHYKLVNALTGLLPFHVSTEAQLPSEREAYRIAWKTEDDLADFVEWLKGRKAI